MAAGGGMVVDPAWAAGDGALDQALTQPQTPAQRAMAELMPANDKYGTPYYAAKTDKGDFAGAVMVENGRRVRLVDPSSGEVLVEGIGPEGAQKIVTIANSVSQDLGRKAAWQIQGETEPDQFQTMAAERYDPKKPGLLGTLLQIAAPMLGAAIPGLLPVLGAALGGGAATAINGGNLKQSLLGGLTAGVGNVAGGALSGVFQGAPLTSSMLRGSNPLGALMSGAGAGPTAADIASPGYAQAQQIAAAQAAARAAGLDPLAATTGGLGGAAGGGTALWGPTVTGAAGGAGGALGTVLGGAAGTGIVGGGPGNPSTTATPEGEPTSNDGVDINPLDIAGRTLGQIGSDLAIYGGASLLGGGGNGGDALGSVINPTGQGIPRAPNEALTITADAGSGESTPAPAPPPAVSLSSAPAGGAAAAPSALLSVGGGNGGAALPSAGVPSNVDTDGSFAPDIYPWKKLGEAA